MTTQGRSNAVSGTRKKVIGKLAISSSTMQPGSFKLPSLRAATVQIGIPTRQIATMSGSALSDQIDEVLALAADILMHPKFDEQELARYKARTRAGLEDQRGDLWMSTNERDELGEDLAPDYISSVQRGGFYGWPWFYLGNHLDPRHKDKHPELAGKVLVPPTPVDRIPK